MTDRSRYGIMKELRHLGFRREWEDRDVCQYVRVVGNRQLDVQLWANGHHRVSHARVTKYGPHWSTRPTEFRTLGEMKDAIAKEWFRPTDPGIDGFVVQPKEAEVNLW